MQLKKNGRDPRFADSRDDLHEDELVSEASEEFAVHAPDVANRPNRPRLAEGEADAPVARSASAARAESVIDGHSTFDGRYETEQDLRVQGTISGEIVCRGVFTVEHEATARARVQTRDALIRGHLEGDIICTGRLLLASTSVVSGTIKAATLIVEEGATLTGNVETAATVANARPAAPVASTPPAEVRRAPTTMEDRRLQAEAVGASSGSVRNARQAPNFAFVPTDERAPADRN